LAVADYRFGAVAPVNNFEYNYYEIKLKRGRDLDYFSHL